MTVTQGHVNSFLKHLSSLFIYCADCNTNSPCTFKQGHAPAGGCLLSMCCDHRVMTDNEKYKIGLNETLLVSKCMTRFVTGHDMYDGV